MDNLETKIKEVRKTMPLDVVKSIDAVDWSQIIDRNFGNTYNQEQVGFLKNETSLLIYGLLEPQDYEKKVQKILNLSDEKVLDILNNLDKLIFKKIKSELEKNMDEEKMREETPDEIPLPPYAKNESEGAPLPEQEADVEILEDTGIKVVEQKENTPKVEEKNALVVEKTKFSISEDKMLADSGISVIEENDLPEKEHLLPNTTTQKKVLDGLENPPSATSSIVGQKLGGGFVNTHTANNHSFNKEAVQEAPQKEGRDPYHEPIE